MKEFELALRDASVAGGPGYSVAVGQGDNVFFSEASGFSCIERKEPITSKSLFDIASLAKQFTAAAINILDLEGLLSLSDKVCLHLPFLPKYCDDITIIHLLNHTSGLPDYVDWFFDNDMDNEIITNNMVLSVLKKFRGLNHQPGAAFEYSNTGYFLLFLIIEKVSGKKMKKFCNEAIFSPLGMLNTFVYEGLTNPMESVVSAYTEKTKGIYKVEVKNWEPLGDGSVVSNALDLLKWANIFYSSDSYWHDISLRLQKLGKLNNGAFNSYAQGIDCASYKGVTRIAHDGSWGGYRSYMTTFPERKFSVVVLANFDESDPVSLAKNIVDVMLGTRRFSR